MDWSFQTDYMRGESGYDLECGMPHHSWMVQKTKRRIDRVGIAVALAFLIALALWAGLRDNKTENEQPVASWSVQPVSAPGREPNELPNSSLTLTP